MTRRAFAVVALVVVVLVAAAVGATWYVTNGSSSKTEGRCEYTPSSSMFVPDDGNLRNA
jgi:hypothetical protein